MALFGPLDDFVFLLSILSSSPPPPPFSYFVSAWWFITKAVLSTWKEIK